jgi:hypothetical protein
MILFLVAALICWAVAAVPGFIQIAVDRVDWGWLGLFFFGLWVLLSGGQIGAFLHRRSP